MDLFYILLLEYVHTVHAVSAAEM